MEAINDMLQSGLVSKVLIIAVLAVAVIGVVRALGPGAASAGQVLSAAEAHQKALRGEITLVDVRTPEEWKQTGLPASAHAITMHQQGPKFVEQLDAALGGDRSKPLAVICRTGNRTGSLVGPLEKAGYTNVINVAEGMAGGRYGAGWARSGLPLRKYEAGKSAPPKVATQN